MTDTSSPSTFDKVSAAASATMQPSQLNQLLKAYQTGVMKPEDAAQFESDVHAGLIALPDTVHLAGKPPAAENVDKPTVELPANVIKSYNIAAKNPYDPGAMDYAARRQLDADLSKGLIKLPTGTALDQSYLGLTGNIKELATGELRSTPETRNNPDYTYMPEFSTLSAPALKTAFGTMVATNPKEIAQIIKTQFPSVGVTQDAKGNYLFQSGVDGKTYALKPGATIDDVAKGVGVALAFTPAGRAETIIGGGVANAATEAGLQAIKASTGGDFSGKDVGIAGGLGLVIPGASRIYQAGKEAISGGARGLEAGAAPEAAAAAETAPKSAPVKPGADFTVDKYGTASGTTEQAAKAPVTSAAAPAAEVKASGNGFVEYKDANGNTVTRTGPENWRNNNPGNIQYGPFAKSNGAIGADGKFAVFPDYATGRAAKETLLFESPAYKDLTVGQAISKWAPPSENNTAAYIESVAKQTGIDATTPLSKLSAEERGNLMDAMQAHEGWKPGKEVINGVEHASPPVNPNQVDTTATVVSKANVGNTPAKTTPEFMPPTDLAQTARTAATEGIGSNNAKQILAEQAAPDAKVLEAAKRLGIEDHLQPDHISTNQTFRELNQVIKSIPGSELHAQETAGLAKVADRANSLIEELGGSKDLSTVSSNVKEHLETTQATLDKLGENLYSRLRRNIPATTTVEPDNILNFIDQRAQELGGVENLSPMERSIYRKLTPKEVTSSVPQVQEGQVMSAAEYKALQAARQGGTELKRPTYALLDDVRRSVGNGLKNAGEFKDADTGLKNHLYKLLTNDQAKVAEANGMGNTWKLAKLAVQQRKGIEDDLKSLFGKQVDGTIVNSLKQGVEVLSSGDASKIAKLLTHIPEKLRQEVVASGLSAAFQKGSRSGTMNFNGYARWYEGLLKNKQAYHAIMSNITPEGRKQLSDLYRVSNGISLATKEFLRTGKLSEGVKVIKEGMQQVDSLSGRLYEAAAHLGKHAGKAVVADMVGGHGLGMATAVVSALKSSGKTDALKAVDALLVSPEFEKAAKQIATGQTKPGVSALAYSKPFLRFARALGSPKEMTDRERWLMQALQADNNNQN